MNRRTRMGWQLGALGAVVGAVIAALLLPMKTTAIKIDGPVNSAQHIDTYVWMISLGIIVLIVSRSWRLSCG